MGAWGPDTFENDEACDWTYALEEKGMGYVLDALDAALADPWDPLDAGVAAEGLAACDVVARLGGKFGQQDAYTEAADSWVSAQTESPSLEVLAKARDAIDRILGERRGLAQLWRDAGEEATWRACVLRLKARLDPNGAADLRD